MKIFSKTIKRLEVKETMGITKKLVTTIIIGIIFVLPGLYITIIGVRD